MLWVEEETFPFWLIVNGADGIETERFSFPIKLEDGDFWLRGPGAGFDRAWKHILYGFMAFGWAFPKGG